MAERLRVWPWLLPQHQGLPSYPRLWQEGGSSGPWCTTSCLPSHPVNPPRPLASSVARALTDEMGRATYRFVCLPDATWPGDGRYGRVHWSLGIASCNRTQGMRKCGRVSGMRQPLSPGMDRDAPQTLQEGLRSPKALVRRRCHLRLSSARGQTARVMAEALGGDDPTADLPCRFLGLGCRITPPVAFWEPQSLPLFGNMARYDTYDGRSVGWGSATRRSRPSWPVSRAKSRRQSGRLTAGITGRR